MASVFKRGSKSRPRWYVQFKGADGKWKMEPTDAATKAEAWVIAEQRQADVRAGKPDPRNAPTCGALMPVWLDSLVNRNKKGDRYTAEKHLLPAFKDRKPREIEHTDIVQWLDRLKTGEHPLAGGTQRSCLNLLSRFFGWAMARGHAKINPVRQLPKGERPRQAPKSQDAPWIKDDAVALAIAAALPSPFGLMYFIGNRCGMRPGEVFGLRVSDLAELEHGRVRVRYSEAGPLKEDDGRGEAKVKWAPAPPDTQLALASWLAKRKSEEAQLEDYLFDAPKPKRGKGWGFYTKMQRSRAWRALAKTLRGEMTWYEASRPLEEVSGALGHSTPAVTLRHYSRFVRKTYSPAMLGGLKLTDAKVIPFVKTKTG